MGYPSPLGISPTITVALPLDENENGMSTFDLRDVAVADTDHLWIALRYAVAWQAPEPDVRQAQTEAAIRCHVEGWGRPGDIGIAAFTGQDVFAGAAWVRHFKIAETYGAVKDGVPVLAIGILAKFRGRGLGTRLLREVMAMAKDHGATEMSLSVERENSVALRLYERLGFAVIDDDPGGALDMLATL